MSWIYSVTLGLLYAACASGQFDLRTLWLAGVVPVAMLFSTAVSVGITPIAVWSLRTGKKNLYVYGPILWIILATLELGIVPITECPELIRPNQSCRNRDFSLAPTSANPAKPPDHIIDKYGQRIEFVPSFWNIFFFQVRRFLPKSPSPIADGVIPWPGNSRPRAEDALILTKNTMSTSPQEQSMPFPKSWERTVARHPAEAEELESVAPTDEKLMALLKEGEIDALRTLFSRFSRLVMGIALRILRDRGEAEEIVQDVFVYLHGKAGLYDPGKGAARRWIVQLAWHKSLTRREYLARRAFYVGTDVESLVDTLLGGTDLDREVESKLNREQLEKAFEELTETQRRTLALFFFEGLELREVSERMNETLSNVRHYYYRGLQRLRNNSLVRKMREK
jgi:RNA polymerase sigma-70 factor (ECF subfamily)